MAHGAKHPPSSEAWLLTGVSSCPLRNSRTCRCYANHEGWQDRRWGHEDNSEGTIDWVRHTSKAPWSLEKSRMMKIKPAPSGAGEVLTPPSTEMLAGVNCPESRDRFKYTAPQLPALPWNSSSG